MSPSHAIITPAWRVQSYYDLLAHNMLLLMLGQETAVDPLPRK